MPSSTGFPTKEWYWSPTKDWCWSPFKVWCDSGHFHRPTQRTLLSPFHILTGDDFHFLYVPSHSHFHFLFTVWERGSLPCQHQQRIFQRDFSTWHYFPHQVPNTNLFLRQTSATMDEWFEYLKDHYYLQPCLHHNMAVCSIRPPHPGVNWMMKIHQIVKNLNFRLSPYSVLPRWEFLTRTGFLAFSLSTFLSCYLFGIVIIIIIGMNMTLISYHFMPIIINISPQQNDNFVGRYLQFYQPMVLNSLVVSLVPVAILSLQVDLLHRNQTTYCSYMLSIRASWTRTGRVCWRTSVSPRRGSPSLAPSPSPSIWSSRCQSGVESKTTCEKDKSHLELDLSQKRIIGQIVTKFCNFCIMHHNS